MSRKVKSEIDFVLKVFILFLILFANKLHKSTDNSHDSQDFYSIKNIPAIEASIQGYTQGFYTRF